MNPTLICVIVVLVLSAIIGLKRGILKMLLPLVFAVAAVIVLVFLTPEITKYISSNTDWDENVRAATEEYFEEKELLLSEDSLREADVIPPMLLDCMNEKAEEYLEAGFDSYNEYIITKVSDTIFSAAVMVGIFLTMLLIFVVIRIIISVVGKMPVIRCVNRFAGMLAGLLLGLLTIEFMFIVLMIFHNTSWAIAIHQDIAENVFLTFIYNHNLLFLTITKIF